MDFQIIVVGIIILFALIYVGFSVGRKIKSFSSKSACGIDCGCGTPIKKEKISKKVEV